MNALSAPPFPTNPTLGQWHGNWCWNGARWVATPMSGVRVLTTVFNAPGTFPYMPSPGLVSLTVECCGGGGGGGGAQSTIPSPGVAGWLCAGGGGGSGGYSRTTVAAALVAGGVQVIVGSGGAGGGPGPVSGAVGATTSFGAFCVANGGNGGSFGDINAGGAGEGGWWAPQGIGDIASLGNSGETGQLNYYDPAEQASGQSICSSGRGGASYFGSSAPQSIQAPAGSPGTAGYFGSGGSGAVGGGAGPGPQTGGRGGDGICIITEYCWNDTDGGEVNPPIEVNARVAVTHVPPPCPPNPCPPGWTEFDGD